MIRRAYDEYTEKKALRKGIQEQVRENIRADVTAYAQVQRETCELTLNQVEANAQQIHVESSQLAEWNEQFLRKTVRWKSNLKKLQTTLQDFKDVDKWARDVETDMKLACSSLEYSCKELNKSIPS